MIDAKFEQFAENFHQDILDRSRDTGTEVISEEHFTELMLESLADAGEIDDHEICSHQSKGIKVNGYTFYNDNESLDLFISHYSGKCPPPRISRTVLQLQLNRLKTFFDRAISQNYSSLGESSPPFDLANRIYQLQNKLTRVRLFVLTDGLASVDTIEDEFCGSLKISHHIWDIQRLYRLASSGFHAEPIEIDLVKSIGKPLPCLPMPEANPVYATYLCIMPANTLADLYGMFGPRLLERNVRAFLQMRGNINKGIRDTIVNTPYMFLAYNNGISATAESVDLMESKEGNTSIRLIRDFQIVNGGQTTASIYHTRTKEKQDISKVYVQVKLTVLKNPENINAVVPKISEYANSQNKINAADFTSNDPFHITIQKWSRTIWAPAKQGSQFETHWYYERVRGQYQDDKGRKITLKEKREFGEQNPTNQRFTKTDFAKYENSWDQLPHFVSLGAEKNYREFILRYHDQGEFDPDPAFFSLLISKAILFRQIDKIIAKQKYGGYKAQIVTYTVALLSKLTAQRINLEKIWKEQGLSPVLEKAIINLSLVVHTHITTPLDGQNVTEWCKKKKCWELLLQREVHLPDELIRELVDESVLNLRDVRARQRDNKNLILDDDWVESSDGVQVRESRFNSYEQKLNPERTSTPRVEQPIAVQDEKPLSVTAGNTSSLADSLRLDPTPDQKSVPRVEQPIAVLDEKPLSVTAGDTLSRQFSDTSKPLESIVTWGSKGKGDGEFIRPTGVAIDKEGNVYVSDWNKHRIQKFMSDGTFIMKWGSEGNSDGQFKVPSDVTVDDAGNIWVVDSFNFRIQKFSNEGQFLGKIDRKGEGDGELSIPHGIAADHTGNVYVTDRGNHRIQKYSTDGTFVAKWDGNSEENGTLMEPYSIAVGSGGNIYVVEAKNNRILLFSSAGTLITTWGSFGTGEGQFDSPGGIAVDDRGNVWIADTKNNRIQKFTTSGTFVTECGCRGLGDEQFYGLTGIALDRAGNLYVVDTNNYRIQKFGQPDYGLISDPSSDKKIPLIEDDPEKNDQKPEGFVADFGNLKSTEKQFDYPSGIAADIDGNIFVTDKNRHLIRKFSSDGTIVIEWGSRGSGEGQFKNPEGITVDVSGNIWVADTGNNRIQKFAPDGSYLSRWGRSGRKNGQFRNPCDIAVDRSSNVWVADKNNNRIQKFTPDGFFLEKWVGTRSDHKEFNYPSGVAVDRLDNVYIADTYNFRILKFSSSGTFVAEWGEKGPENGQFGSPTGITVDSDGNFLVVDRSNHRIQKFSPKGSHIATWDGRETECANLKNPQDVAVDDAGNIFVTDSGNSRILKFRISHTASVLVSPGEEDVSIPDIPLIKNRETVTSLISENSEKKGPYIVQLGHSGGNIGEFGTPAGVAVDKNGNLLVADTGNNRIQKFTQQGIFVYALGKYGGTDGQFDHPSGVAVDRYGQIWVADTNNHRIQKFTSGGKFVLQWGIEGREDEQFDHPSGIAVDNNGNVYVADTWNHRIQIFSPEGSHMATWGEMGMTYGRFRDPLSVAVDRKGNVWVADTGNNRIQKFSKTGEFQAALGGDGHGDGQFDSPSSIAVDGADNIWVTDQYNNRIQKFRSDGTFIAQFGTGGQEKGQFSWPGGIAVDGDSTIYVADTRNDRIQKLTSGASRAGA